jgi:hypothetical protein
MSEPKDDKMCPYSEPNGEWKDEPGGKATKQVRKRCLVCGRRIVTDKVGFPPHKKKEWYKKKKIEINYFRI